MTSSPHHMVNTCAAKSAPTHQIRILWGVCRWAGCVLVSISERAGSRTLEKFSRRDRDRDCAKFESSRRFRGSNMNPKKKSRRCRASVSIQALDLAISRFIHSLDQEEQITARIKGRCHLFKEKETSQLTIIQPSHLSVKGM